MEPMRSVAHYKGRSGTIATLGAACAPGAPESARARTARIDGTEADSACRPSRPAHCATSRRSISCRWAPTAGLPMRSADAAHLANIYFQPTHNRYGLLARCCVVLQSAASR
jgi:hypothetical protein